jgi:nitroreductase
LIAIVFALFWVYKKQISRLTITQEGSMIDLLRKRRSVRNFTEAEVAPETVDLLIEALLRAPSSRGINPWEFVIVDDRDLLLDLSRAKQHGSEFLQNATLAIVVCADRTKSDVWVEDCSIAAIIVQLTALSLGLGSCWAQIRNRSHDGESTAEDHVRRMLELPENIVVESIIGIGYPAENPPPVPASRLQYDKIRRNGWNG